MDRRLSVRKVKKLPGFPGLAALRQLVIAIIIIIGLLALLGCSVEDVEDPVHTGFFLAPGASVTIALSNGSEYEITFEGVSGRTWCYTVAEVPGSGSNGRASGIDFTDLSHWLLAIDCHVEGGHIVEASPDDAEIGYDGSTEYIGVKWELDEGFSEGTFCITLDDDYAEGLVEIVVKAGNDFASGFLPGPTCEPIIIHDQGGGS